MRLSWFPSAVFTTLSYHISYQTLFQYHTSKQRHKKHNMILRTWSKGQKGLRQSCPNKGFNKYTETYKNSLYTHTDKNTQEHRRHAPKWNQLYSDNKTDFSWFRKCLVVFTLFYSFVQRIPKRRSTISNWLYDFLQLETTLTLKKCLHGFSMIKSCLFWQLEDRARLS